mgnify:CR=1 FL=1
MRVCVVGSGGREHALAHVLGHHHDVVVAPGNPGIPGSVDMSPSEIDADLFVIGPEAPLVDGLADRLRAAGQLVFGPGADGARLEGSKAWMKEVLVEAGVSTAAHGTFSDEAAALAFLRWKRLPVLRYSDLLIPSVALGEGSVAPEAAHDRALAEATAFADILVELNHQGQTILLIEHNLAEVRRICSRLVVLDNGRKLDEGSPEVVLTNPAVQEAYIGQGTVYADN